MPIVEATSVQLEIPSSLRNRPFWVQKKKATTTAASSAPISGRRRRRAAWLICARRSSETGAGGGGATVPAEPVAGPDAIRFLLITSLSSRARAAGGRLRGAEPAAALLAGPRGRELRDRRGVGLVDEARAGEDRPAAADGVGVLLEELEEHDGEVALQVLLLVDREQDRAVLDVLDYRRGEVERGDLRARARALDRGDRRGRDVRVQRDDRVEGLVGLQLGLELGLRR